MSSFLALGGCLSLPPFFQFSEFLFTSVYLVAKGKVPGCALANGLYLIHCDQSIGEDCMIDLQKLQTHSSSSSKMN